MGWPSAAMAISGSQNQDFRTIPNLWSELDGVLALDLGCGIGLYSDALAKRGARVVGIDFEFDNLVLARENAAAEKVHWVCADARHLPFKRSVFAVVVSVEVLTHTPVENRRLALQEMARTAVAGADVYITLHNKRRLDWGSWLVWRSSQSVYETGHLNVWPTDIDEAIEMVENCGMLLFAKPRFMNFHSRFSFNFATCYPLAARGLALIEVLCSHLPLVRRISITFLLQLRRDESKREARFESEVE